LGECTINKFTFPINSYKIFLNDSNGHGCYFFKYYYFNICIIHVQLSINLFKSMWKFIFNVTNVIFFNLEVLKQKPTKSIWIMAHVNLSKTYDFGTNFKTKNKNCNLYGLMKIWSNFNHQKSLIIKQLRFSKNNSSCEFIILYHIIYWVLITNLECESI
jgi:hypothetical protein